MTRAWKEDDWTVTRTTRTVRPSLVLAVVLGMLVGSGAPEARAQWQDARPLTTRDVRPVATLGDARAIGVDPRGRLYVADAGRNVVSVHALDGRILNVIGGTGGRVFEFDEPTDVDPTNGLSVWVSDAGNGRLQQFSDDGQFLEALPVGRDLDRGGLRGRQPSYGIGRDRPARGDGRPGAVATTSANDVFAIDVLTGAVLMWDARRERRVVLERDRRRGGIQDPIDLAIHDERELLVADRAQGAVMAYDLFGSFLRRIQPEPMPDLTALLAHEGRVWIVRPTRIYVCDPDGSVLHTLNVQLGAPLVDVQPTRRGIYLLTRTDLFLAPPLP